MKRIVAFFAALALTFGGVAPFAFADDDEIVALYTNDVHCGVDDSVGYDGLALYKREMQARHKNVVLVDAGDALQGGTIGALSKGAYIIELMNAVGYDVAGLGNHEFDYGVETLLTRADELKCGYVSCNFKSLETNAPVFKPYKIVDFGEKRIAFVGLVTPQTFSSSTPAYFRNPDGEHVYSFCEQDGELYEVAQQNVDKAREECADYVVLVGHLGEHGDVIERWSAQVVAANTTGVDAIIDAHTHEVVPELIVKNKDGDPVIITQTGTKLARIGKMTFSKDGIKTELVDRVPEPEDSMGLDETTWMKADDRGGRCVDVAVNRKISEIKEEIGEKLSEKVGRVDFELCDKDPETGKRMVRNSETNLSDLFADAMKALYKTDVAFHNGGGVRKNVKAGEITYADALNAFPFGNRIFVVKASGRQILDSLEFGARTYPEENGGFLGGVSGLEYTIDVSVKSGVVLDKHDAFVGVTGGYRVKNVTIEGEPLDLEKTYSVCSNEYLLQNGGDGYIMSGKCELCETQGELDVDMFVRYIREELSGCVPDVYRNPKGLGRITIVDGVPEDALVASGDSASPEASPEIDSRDDGCSPPVNAVHGANYAPFQPRSFERLRRLHLRRRPAFER